VHGLADILDLLFARVDELDAEVLVHLLPHGRRDANASGCGERLQPRGNVDAVAGDVVTLDDDVAEVDPNAEFDPLVGGDEQVARSHLALHLHGAAQRGRRARKFDQHAVAGRTHDAAAVLGDLRIDQLRADLPQPGMRAGLVALHEPRIADDVGDDDRGELAVDGHGGKLGRARAPPIAAANQDFSAASTSSSIFLASPNSIRLLSL
jgi:hypothetical protein